MNIIATERVVDRKQHLKKGVRFSIKLLIFLCAFIYSPLSLFALPLHDAVLTANEERVQALLNANVDPDSFDELGLTALHWAVRTNESQIVRTLLNGGAAVNIKTSNLDGFTPLHIAAYRGNNTMVTLLLDNGADINARNSVGDTPLHTAAGLDQIRVVITMLDYNASKFAKNSFGKTPADVAPRNSRSQLLLRRPQAISASIGETETNNETANATADDILDNNELITINLTGLELRLPIMYSYIFSFEENSTAGTASDRFILNSRLHAGLQLGFSFDSFDIGVETNVMVGIVPLSALGILPVLEIQGHLFGRFNFDIDALTDIISLEIAPMVGVFYSIFNDSTRNNTFFTMDVGIRTAISSSLTYGFFILDVLYVLPANLFLSPDNQTLASLWSNGLRLGVGFAIPLLELEL